LNNILGISAGFHDAAATVIDSVTGEILFASHSERFSKKKHDKHMSADMLKYATSKFGPIGTIAYYEKPWLKRIREYMAGQPITPIEWSLRGDITKHFKGIHGESLINNAKKIVNFGHHKSHAAAGFQTSPYSAATVVVIDAIGEMDTISIWNAHYDKKGNAKYKLKWRQGYPDSIGLFYSAVTKHVGLKPLDEEYILMGMAAYGQAWKTSCILEDRLIATSKPPTFKENLHIGLPEIDFGDATDYDIAAGAQRVTEHLIGKVFEKARSYANTNNVVYMGGAALNCSANRLLGKYFNNIWIMPNPGDAGSSLGAAALAYGKRLQWKDAFLGYNIKGEYPVDAVLDSLLKDKIVGVASGKAEFGPRALGNRSLLADPRGKDIKDKVNKIKQRQKFRPFAPVILAEHVNDYFDMPYGFKKSDYMQVTAMCLQPAEFPAIIHADTTSRVQTVPNDGSGIRRLLEAWYKATGCPMLLNTSLNIRGAPAVNDIEDAKKFEQIYGVTVHTSVL
jgi:carbamoyltransferase